MLVYTLLGLSELQLDDNYQKIDLNLIYGCSK